MWAKHWNEFMDVEGTILTRDLLCLASILTEKGHIETAIWTSKPKFKATITVRNLSGAQITQYDTYEELKEAMHKIYSITIPEPWELRNKWDFLSKETP